MAKDKVALLAEGVDRNNEFKDVFNSLNRSPSSRRAWIEMCRDCGSFRR